MSIINFKKGQQWLNMDSNDLNFTVLFAKASKPAKPRKKRVKRKPQDIEDVVAPEGNPTCIACIVNVRRILVKPCNHLCLCASCSLQWFTGKKDACPVCKTEMEELVVVFQ